MDGPAHQLTVLAVMDGKPVSTGTVTVGVRERCEQLPCVVQLAQSGGYDVLVSGKDKWGQTAVRIPEGKAVEVTVDLVEPNSD